MIRKGTYVDGLYGSLCESSRGKECGRFVRNPECQRWLGQRTSHQSMDITYIVWSRLRLYRGAKHYLWLPVSR